MPPSGFSQKAINGLLKFVKANYESTLSKYNGNGKESEFLITSVNDWERKAKKTVQQNTPLEISEEGTQGIVTFITSCYEDLIEEIEVGKDKHNRSVIDGKAMQKEIGQIGAYLEEFTI